LEEIHCAKNDLISSNNKNKSARELRNLKPIILSLRLMIYLNGWKIDEPPTSFARKPSSYLKSRI
jgi:hypothetical protein